MKKDMESPKESHQRQKDAREYRSPSAQPGVHALQDLLRQGILAWSLASNLEAHSLTLGRFFNEARGDLCPEGTLFPARKKKRKRLAPMLEHAGKRR